ncbi:Carboxypeptidase [Mycena sanguinolenta]|uniref:Carboxypeptidase n=1 Tax=Mycena sanguinolenta TaxID=230812 RepID=A0A8H6YLS6_9AGAR|nr:Carboxypeptidase [Mycena sanguinolenta]
MPPELLSLILAFASRRSTYWERRQDPAPWTASQVCRRWRAITLSQPLFWVHIDLDMTGKERETHTPFRLEAQLKRTGNLPLRINFGCRWKYERTEQELALLAVLVQHCARWEDVRLDGPVSWSSELACIRGNLPRLRKLRVLLWLSTQEEEPLVDVFELAPNLREASVNVEPHHHSSGTIRVPLPFSELQQYVARGTWDSQLSALRSASNLVDCALDVVGISTPLATLVVLPHLRRLSLRVSSLLACLDTPHTPQLEELYCSHDENRLSLLFAQRPPLQLQKLGLLFIASATDICDIVHSVPTITDLGVYVYANSFDDLSASLVLRDEPTDIAPALRSLIIDCSESLGCFLFRHYDREMLVDMVISRWRTGRLCSIHIPDKEGDYLVSGGELLEGLKNEGLVFSSSSDRNETVAEMVPLHLRF